MKSTNHLDSSGKELYLAAVMSPNGCISGLRHLQLLWKMLTEGWHAKGQELRTRVPSEAVTGIFQPHLCLCPSPLAGCSSSRWSLLPSSVRIGARAWEFPEGKVKHYSTAGRVLFSCSFTTLEQVFLCCCFIRHPIASYIDLSHLAAGKYSAFWIAHIYCDLYAKFPQEKSRCDIVASFQVEFPFL